MVFPPSEWFILSTGLDLQLQSDWFRRVPLSPIPQCTDTNSPLFTGAAVAYTEFTTEAIKWTVGRPRPEWLGRCQPDLAKVQAELTSTAVAMFDRSICTSTDQNTLDDGQRSFPSGHASGKSTH